MLLDCTKINTIIFQKGVVIFCEFDIIVLTNKTNGGIKNEKIQCNRHQRMQ